MAAKISVTPRFNQPPLELRGPKQIAEWATSEISFWTPLAGARTSSPEPAYLRWDHARQNLESLKSLAADREEGWEERAQRAAEEAVAGLLLLSNDPRSQFLAQLKEKGESDRVIGAVFIGLLEPQRLAPFLTHHKWIADAQRANIIATSYLILPTVEGAAAMEESWSRTSADWFRLLGDQRASLTEIEAALDGYKEASSESIRIQQERFADLVADFEKERDALRKKFEDELALRAPTIYWKEKASEHEQEAQSYRNYFAGILAAGVVVLGLVSVVWFIPALQTGDDDLWPLILFSAAIAVWAWPLRLTSKLYLSHRHLHEDASEREIIARTFVALQEETGAFTPEDRQLLLSALFRASSGGLVKEEGGLSLADLVVARTVMKG